MPPEDKIEDHAKIIAPQATPEPVPSPKKWTIGKILLVIVGCIAGVVAVVIAGVVMLIVLGAKSVLDEGQEPSRAALAAFDASQVSTQATKTKTSLQADIAKLPMTAQGFTLVAQSYADGCLPYRGAEDLTYQKYCYGRAVNLYSSPKTASDVEMNLTSALSQIGWRTPSPSPLEKSNCYGSPDDIATATDESIDYDLEYQVSSLPTTCQYPLSLTTSQLVISNLYGKPTSEIIFSPLTHTFNQSTVLANSASSGAQSYVAVAFEYNYFNQTVPQG